MYKQFFLILAIIVFSLQHLYGQGIIINGNKKKAKGLKSGATIERSSEANAYLERAKSFIKAEKYQDAVLLLKTTVEKYGNTLTSENEEFYLPLKAHIHRMILELPKKGLDLYFVEVDSVAGSLFSQAKKTNNAALYQKVIKRYYLSNFGDDACYYYGLYLLDKGSLFSAKDYLELALHHPLRSISKSRIQLCLGYIYGVFGETQKHKSNSDEVRKVDYLLSQIKKVDQVLEDKANKNFFETFRTSVTQKNQNSLEIDYEYGNRQVWTPVLTNFENFIFNKPSNRNSRHSNSLNTSKDKGAKIRKSYVKLWHENFWYPARNILTYKDSVVFRDGDKVSCFDLNTNKLLWRIDLSPQKTLKKSGRNYYYRYGNKSRKMPRSEAELLLFSNQLGNLMRIENDSIYILVGHRNTGHVTNSGHIRWSRRATKKIVSGNKIYKINLKSGKRSMIIGELELDHKDFYNVIFLNLPVKTPYGLYLSYVKNNELYGVMIDDKKRIIWKKYLCSYKNGQSMLMDTCSVVYGEESLYIGIDFGVLLKLKANDGSYAWVKRYGTVTKRRNYYNPLTVKPGAEDNRIIYQNGRVIIIPSDTKNNYIYNSRTGDEIAVISEDFLGFRRYLIGHDSTGFIMGGEKGLRKFSIEDGALLWQSNIEGSFGRGQLSNKRVYFSSKDSVYELDAISGKKITKISVHQDEHNDAIGNICLSSDKLVISHLNGFYSVSNITVMIDKLSAKLKKNPSAANHYERGQLYQKFGKELLAFKDYESAITKSKGHSKILQKSSEKLFNIFKSMSSKRGDVKNLLPAIEKLLEEPKYKMVIGYWKGVISKNKDNHEKALEQFTQVFKNNKFDDSLLITLNEKSFKPWVLSLKNILSIIKTNPQLEQKFIESLIADEANTISNTAKLLFLLDVLNNKTFSDWSMNKLLRDHSEASAKNQIIFDHLGRHKNRMISTSALYWMFKCKISLSSFWEAKEIYSKLKKEDLKVEVYTTSGNVNLSGKLMKYQPYFVGLENKFKPGVNEIVDPPLEKIWSSKDISTGDKAYVGLGIDKRTEFLENHIFLFDKSKHKMYCTDLFTGEIKWLLSVKETKKTMYFTQWGNRADLRDDNLAIYKDEDHFWAIDLITGKRLWKDKHDQADLVGIRADVFVSTLGNVAIIRDVFTGKVLWTKKIDSDLPNSIFVSDKTIAFISENYSKLVITDHLFGKEIKKHKLNNVNNNSFIHLMGNCLYFQGSNSKSVCFDLMTGQELWSKSLGFYYYGQRDTFFDLKNGSFVILCFNNRKIYCIDKRKGTILWSKEITTNKGDRKLEIFPVKGSDKIIARVMSRVINKEATITLKELLVKDGSEVSKIQRTVTQNEVWRFGDKGLHRLANSGEVYPIEKEDKKGKKTIYFYRKRDGSVVKKHIIKVKELPFYSGFFFKGAMLFANKNPNSNIFIAAYSNKKFLESKKTYIKKMKNLLIKKDKNVIEK